MTDYGVIPTGFRRKTFEIIFNEIGGKWKQNISRKLLLEDPKSVVANLLNPISTSFAECWELGEDVSHLLDVDNATRSAAVILGAIVGMEPLEADYGEVTATVNLDEGNIYAANSLTASVSGEPLNLWENTTAIDTTAAVGPDNYSVTYRSLSASAAARAPAGTLTVMAVSINGWNSITNATDAEEGRDLETPEEMMIRRQQELASQGSATNSAIQADVADVNGVQQVRVFTNRSDIAINGIPPHSHRVVIYDGDDEDATNNSVAQAIFDSQADGIRSFGTLQGTATADDGTTSIEFFDRAETTELYLNIEVESAIGVSESAVKAAASAFVAGLFGERVVIKQMERAILEEVDGVDDILELKLDVVFPPVGTVNLTADADQRFNLDTANINVIVTEPE
jgi:uncharacterized phage protein gp47/JayE